MDIGFIGLGNMGGPMALNLQKAGHTVIAYDISPSALERAAQAGAVPARSPAEVARGAETVLTSLPTPLVVESVYLGPGGLLEGARAGQLFVDLSSITPHLARKLAERLAEVDVEFLDAPVSGGTTGAAAGTLAIMVGGDPQTLARAEPVLRCIGERIFHAGPVGAGSTIKILNQLLMGINSMAMLEMLSLARRSGIDLALVKEIISASSGFSRAVQTRFDKAAQHDFQPGFAIDLMCKDLRLGREMAKELGAELPVASLVLSIYEQASEQGLGQQDVTAALRLFEGVGNGEA